MNFIATTFIQFVQPKHFLSQYHIDYNPDATALAKERDFEDWVWLMAYYYPFSGWVDFLIQRVIEIVISIPTLPLWLTAAAIVPNEWTALQTHFLITIILGLFGWTGTARRVRGMVLALREADYIVAAQLGGNSNRRLILRHMLHSIASHIIVDLTIAFPAMIRGETALSFLGLGLRSPVVSWGLLLPAAQNVSAIQKRQWPFIPVGLWCSP